MESTSYNLSPTAANFRAERARHQIFIEELAAAVDPPLNTKLLSMYLSGYRPMNTSVAQKIGKAFNSFFGGLALFNLNGEDSYSPY